MKTYDQIMPNPPMRWLCVLLATCLILSPAHSQLVSGTMDVRWNEGSADCVKNPQPPIQVHRYNADTFVLRENLCATYEAPFIYLLIGKSKALLIDTGAVADAKIMPLAQSVVSLLPNDGSRLPLIVVHTHGHLDHRSGDDQFRALPDVEVVPADLESVKSRLGIGNWPNGMGQIDLGDRVIDVIPTPGHYASHVAYYDRQTGLLFSGDFLLPGRLLIEDTDADLVSARRVAEFVGQHPIAYVLGGHIELDEAGKMFFGTRYHPNERPLQLTKEDVLALPGIVSGFNGFYAKRGVYILMNQNRILIFLGIAAIVLLVAIILILHRLWRWLRSPATAN
ncbi:MAG TPA: MBL fold metallo-hydrolase [Candidatus Udaeobacter sp.]|nr:MBL fold metallo-hydrolase [Candidatus Udaeobacter sp.]